MTYFIKTSRGDLVGAAVATVRPAVHYERVRGTGPGFGVAAQSTAHHRADIVLTGGVVEPGDIDLLDDDGPIAGWPLLEDASRVNPMTILKIENGIAVGKDGRRLGKVVNIDKLIAAATFQPPEPPPAAGAAPPAGGSDTGAAPGTAEPSAHQRAPDESPVDAGNVTPLSSRRRRSSSALSTDNNQPPHA